MAKVENNDNEKFKSIEDIANYAEKTIKDNFIKNIMVGFVSANQMILDFSQDHTLEEVQNFCKSNLKKKNQNAMVNFIAKETNNNQ